MAPVCKHCERPLVEGRAYELSGHRWHVECFRCSRCDQQLNADTTMLVLGDGTLVCNNCSYSCAQCGKKIENMAILTNDQAFCSDCFTCRHCHRRIEDLKYARTSQGIFCMDCHRMMVERKRRRELALAAATQDSQAADPEPDVKKSGTAPDLGSSITGTSFLGSYPPHLELQAPLDFDLDLDFSTNSSFKSTSDSAKSASTTHADDTKLESKLEPEYDQSAADARHLKGAATNKSQQTTAQSMASSQSQSRLTGSAKDGTGVSVSHSSSRSSINSRESGSKLRPESSHKSDSTLLAHSEPPQHNQTLNQTLNQNQGRRGQTAVHNPYFNSATVRPSPGSTPSRSLDPLSRLNAATGPNESTESNGSNGSTGSGTSGTSGTSETTGSTGTNATNATNESNGLSESNGSSLLNESVSLTTPSHTPPPPPSAHGAAPTTKEAGTRREHKVERKLAPSAIDSTPERDNGNMSLPARSQLRPTSPTRSPARSPARSWLSLRSPKNTTPRAATLSGTPTTPLSAPAPFGVGSGTHSSHGTNHSSGTPLGQNNDRDSGLHAHKRSLSDGLSLSPPLGSGSIALKDEVVYLRLRNQELEAVLADYSRIQDAERLHAQLVTEIRGLEVARDKLREESDRLLHRNVQLMGKKNAGSDRQQERQYLLPTQKLPASASTGSIPALSPENTGNNGQPSVSPSKEIPFVTVLEPISSPNHSQSNQPPQGQSISSAQSQGPSQASAQSQWQFLQSSQTRTSKNRWPWRRPTRQTDRPAVDKPQIAQTAQVFSLGQLGQQISNQLGSHKRQPSQDDTVSIGNTSSMVNSSGTGVAPGNMPNSSGAPGVPGVPGPPGPPGALGTSTNSMIGEHLEQRTHADKQAIPIFVQRCLDEVERRGLDVEGIYRKSGSKIQINSILDSFAETGLTPKAAEQLLSVDIHAVTGALKQYLRHLADPVVPFDYYDGYIAAGNSGSAPVLKRVVRSLPFNHYATLTAVAKHLAKVAGHGDKNLMHARNLAVVFAPTLARDPYGDREIPDMQARNEATHLLIVTAPTIDDYSEDQDPGPETFNPANVSHHHPAALAATGGDDHHS